MKNVAGSGGKWLDISAERFPGWIASFSVRHGVSDASGAAGASETAGAGQSPPGPGAVLAVTFGDDHASFTAEDGSVAECYPPFPPPGGASMLAANVGADSATDPAGPATPAEVAAIAEAFAAHARRPRTVGVLLVRLGGYAAGVFTGYPPVLQDAKVGSRLVHGRSAAGGWSQHRFARRREKQANEALDAAADAAVAIFGKRDATVRSKNQITARSGEAAANRRPQPGAAGRRQPAWTPWSSAATAARSPNCGTTRGWRPISRWPPSASSPCPTPSAPSCSRLRGSSPPCE